MQPAIKASMAELLRRLSGSPSEKWPDGKRFVTVLAHGTMSVELYAPVGADPQGLHSQDELYFIVAGRGEIVIADERHAFGPGDVFFVAAGVAHRFESFTDDFATWAVFWGPPGGEADPA